METETAGETNQAEKEKTKQQSKLSVGKEDHH